MFMFCICTSSQLATFGGTGYENIKLKHRNSELSLESLLPTEFKHAPCCCY